MKSIEDADIAKFNVPVILSLLTSVIQEERFCDGNLLHFLHNGCIVKWLERLKELDALYSRSYTKED